LNTSDLNISKPNDAWILHREEITTLKEGNCNVYVVLDAHTGFCFGMETSVDLPSATKITGILKDAFNKSAAWPKKMLISKKDPYVETLTGICDELKVDWLDVPAKYLEVFVKPFKDSFRGFKVGGREQSPASEIERKEMEAFTPETYGPCPCASGEKYKFCCQKAFKPIVFAMCDAQDGRRESALRHMQEAEAKVGRTAEVVCRYAVIWSFFDKEKCLELMDEAKTLNPNHPRLNFLFGIESVAAKDYAKAIEYYQKAIFNYPKESKFHLNETYNNLGTAYYESKNFQEAKNAWEKALVFLPTDRMVKENLFKCIYHNPELPQELREISPFIERFLKILL